MEQASRTEQQPGLSTTQFMTLRLNDIHDLFAPPRIDPFQENYFPQSGIDQITQQMKMSRPRRNLHVTFIIPDRTGHATDLKSEVQTSLKRYSDICLANLEINLKARQNYVLRSLQVGILVLGISLALAAAITNAELFAPWLRTLLSNSISIFGTVALWSPADAFLFGMRPLYNDLRMYKTIRDMSFDIQFE